MSDVILEYIRECTNPWRYKILTVLSKRSCRMVEISKEIGAPTSTVSRALNKLEKLELVRRRDDFYEITACGDILLTILNKLLEFNEIRNELEKAEEFLRMIPDNLKFEFVDILKKTEKRDLIDLFPKAIDDLSRVREYGLYIDRIINYDIYKLMIELNLQGASEKVISTKATILERLETFKQALIDMDLSKKELRIVREKVEMRIYDTPIQLGVLDGKVVYFQYHYAYAPMIRSESKDVIEWCEKVFYHFWERAEPVDIKGLVDSILYEI